MSLPLPKFKWTHSGNYPAGPNLWSGQPLALPPAGSYFTPDVPPDAEEMNEILGQISDDIAGVQSYVAGLGALNWGVTVALNPTLNLPVLLNPYNQQAVMGMCWDPLSLKWLIAVKGVVNSGTYAGDDTIEFWETYDGVSYWLLIDTTGTSGPLLPKPVVGVTPDQGFLGVCADPINQGAFWFFWVDQAHPTEIFLAATDSTGSSFPNDPSHRGSLDATAGQARGAIHPFNGHVLYAVGSTTANKASIYRDLPGVSCAGPVNAVGWQFCDNGSLVMALPTLTATPANYWTSVDGVTWFTQSFAQVGGGTIIQTGDEVVGACWTQDSLGACFLMCILRGTSVVFYRSADGLNWSLQSSPSHFYTNVNVPVSIAAVGAMVVVTGGDGYYGAYSPDGGVTWYASSGARFNRFNNTSIGNSGGNNLTSTFYLAPTVVSSPLGFALGNSLGLKFSSLAGTGAISLN